MIHPPLKSYGFTYDYNSHSFAFDVVARSEEEAKQRVLCMGTACFVGELQQDKEKVETVQLVVEEGEKVA